MNKVLKSRRPRKCYQLKITLCESKPAIWRRIVVPASVRLDRLHEIIQLVMGWKDSHLHDFRFGSRRYGLMNAEPDADLLDEQFYILRSLPWKIGKSFTYEYDLGGGWKHEIVVEGKIPADPEREYPLCLDGENACPPEDCGGMDGYYDLVASMADPTHEDHEKNVDWLGKVHWDLTQFDLKATNKELRDWSRGRHEFHWQRVLNRRD